MAQITLGGNPVETSGELPHIGSKAPDFKLVAIDLSTKTLSDFEDHNLVLNIFPSVDTGVCSASVRQFNEEAAELDNTKVLCISRDLPFRQEQFCAADGLDNVVMLSDFKSGEFGRSYGLLMTNGIFDALLSRCVIIINKEGIVTYTEQVPEIGQEPNYKAALEALMG
ncbi:MAG: thiol peroxidase [Bacteroidia bacterium]|nr:thiol peroxidase [Bacteroidia bacterium]NND10941.1 thiol peroxidase [Flavobacteriaceae bacterium]MBT8310253.1 thiol peroxidase [Bacteroidia bacterium]NNK27620.1 thiol peroxidase [Flavobacteriaceae bacterium]NNL61763.1 thiol peroxidase [Flavobacteriaceae bacterium]